MALKRYHQNNQLIFIANYEIHVFYQSRPKWFCPCCSFGKIFLHFCFASLRGCHSHGIGLHHIGSISLASPFFGCGSIQADILAQAQRPDIVILDRSVHVRHRIPLVELTCPWYIDAKRAKEHKIWKYADLKAAFSNEGCNYNLYMIEVGAQGHILRSSIAQMIKDVSCISLVCSFFIFQARNYPVWSFFASCHLTYRWGAVGSVSQGSFGTPPSPCPHLPSKKWGRASLFLLPDYSIPCILVRPVFFIDTLPIAPVILVLICLRLGVLVLFPIVVGFPFSASVQGGSVYGSRSGVLAHFWDSPIPVGNCGPLSYDVHVR
jgi:hypothetical protein